MTSTHTWRVPERLKGSFTAKLRYDIAFKIDIPDATFTVP